MNKRYRWSRKVHQTYRFATCALIGICVCACVVLIGVSQVSTSAFAEQNTAQSGTSSAAQNTIQPSYKTRHVIEEQDKTYLVINGKQYDLKDKTNHFIEFADLDSPSKSYVPTTNPAQAGEKFALLYYPMFQGKAESSQTTDTFYVRADGELVLYDDLGDQSVRWFVKTLTAGLDDVITAKAVLGKSYDEATHQFTTKQGKKITIKDFSQIASFLNKGKASNGVPFNTQYGLRTGAFNNVSDFASSSTVVQNMNSHYTFTLAPGTRLPKGVVPKITFKAQQRNIIDKSNFTDVKESSLTLVQQDENFENNKSAWLTDSDRSIFADAVNDDSLELRYDAPLSYNPNRGTKINEYRVLCEFSDANPNKAWLEKRYSITVSGNDIDGWNVTLTAKPFPHVDVTFEDKTGTRLASISCEKDATLPTDAIIPTHVMRGDKSIAIAYWYKKGDVTQTKIDLTTTVFSSETALVPRYKDVSIQFMRSDGTLLAPSPITIEAASSIKNLAAPTRDGDLDIIGWYVKGDTTQHPIDLTSYCFLENTNLVALYNAPASTPAAPSNTGNGEASSNTGNGEASSNTGNGEASSSTRSEIASPHESTQPNDATSAHGYTLPQTGDALSSVLFFLLFVGSCSYAALFVRARYRSRR